jgi:hypothetical protein
LQKINNLQLPTDYGVLFAPLSYPNPNQLVTLPETHQGAPAMMREPILSDITLEAPPLESTSCGNHPVRRANSHWSIPKT